MNNRGVKIKINKLVTNLLTSSSKYIEKEVLILVRKQELTDWFDDYGESILTYILLIVRDYELAEDLTQETFLKAFKNHNQFQQNAAIKTWLFAIAHNTTKDYFRKRNPIKYYLDFSFNEKDEQPLPEQVVLMNDENEQLYLAIQQLKPTYKQVITLRKLKEFSTQETALILKWSESKVKMTLKRALEALKEELLKRGHLDGLFRGEI
ncbi:RNA polymerase sigma factor [Oceanihabitans sediminis]|uniref:RNA polymerase sigma factor n=1 Tax=Oceanihabitans sediminis TaxID=1812012 RepID=UPI00299D69E9|nr:RNA polymerase sigma factor [Oceanihabitans sediminis]MDX1774920.1 RNA polymerase sigma factor [Oceanihabitans sediminis]